MHANGFSEKERSSDFCCSTIKKFKELRSSSIEAILFPTPVAEVARLGFPCWNQGKSDTHKNPSSETHR